MDARQIVIFQELASTLTTAGVEMPLGDLRQLTNRCCQRLDEVNVAKTTETPPRPLLLSSKETAKILRCSQAMLRRYIDEEGLRAIPKNPGAVKVHYMFRLEDIQNFLELQSARHNP